MKKLLFFFVAALLLTACDPTEPVNPNNGKGKLDLNARIVLRGDVQQKVSTKALIDGYTPLEVVQEAVSIKFRSYWAGNYLLTNSTDMSRAFRDADKDLEKPALLMWGTDIIDQDGGFVKDFIYGFDVYITDNHNDTIACVPDSVINKARPLIEAAYNDSNYTEVYRLFNEVFTFIPLR
ncbi:MAG TPA: membrane lipoprotein lipid attachment site-containing protein [Paludibacteraceae bacterium]|mgnify:FL=1|nr:membrane lipoprotein lipid attachment site-containing protein [Paludibacteraceae bacterium]HQB69299.1 membrane lipoprotein lipid attachment site-containing protein [Paludibacteraceae bacterium]HRS68050.1 membrane lipoprotein lipid attachment site-containing protein [Paludibacteraceae bacterium]